MGWRSAGNGLRRSCSWPMGWAGEPRGGGAAGGGRPGRVGTESVTQYVANALRNYHTVGSESEHEFTEALRRAAIEAHDVVRAEAVAELGGRQMATTLSLGIAVWPWL